ncbi:MAG TPA: AMP-binding protein [Longimicrobiaceae bacterium]
MTNANIAARLFERASGDPDRVAIVETRGGRVRRTTFGELAGRVERTAAAMAAAGVGRGRVLLFVPMSIDLYVALLATLHAGATAVFVDAWANRRRLDAAVRLAGPDLLIAPPPVHLLRLASPALRRIPRHWAAGRRLLPLARHERAGRPAPAPARPDDPALITFTTGSTGSPKAAVRSHGLLWAQHLALAHHLGLGPDDVDMPTLPIFVLNNLALGVPSVLPDFDPRRPADIDPARIMSQIEREEVTTTSGSPAFYARLAGWCREQGRPLHVRLWTGGAPVYPPLARQLEEVTGGRAHVVYGSTEAEPIAGIGAGAMLRAMADGGAGDGICCGVPVPEIEVRIIRPVDGPVALGMGGWTEWEVRRGEAGEIVVAGEHVVGEYLHAPEETLRHKIREGERVWHRTGDAGRVAEDGALWLLGRVSSRVVRDGVTWWGTPAEVRALSVPGVRHAAFVGLPDGARGQRAVLCVEGATEDPAGRIDETMREALAPIPVDEVRVLPAIPRDPRHASKTDLEALRRLLLSR